MAGYEVSRDGVVLAVVDALGYVDDALAPGRRYRYVVRTIDGAGQRSRGASYVFLTTPDLPPPSPTGLRARVYSATAAGLVWDRSGVFGTRYEVSRDGDPVARTDGITHVDTDLDPRRAYHFEVVALNRQGQRSAPARLMLWTGEGGAPTLRAPPIERVVVYSDSAVERDSVRRCADLVEEHQRLAVLGPASKRAAAARADGTFSTTPITRCSRKAIS